MRTALFLLPALACFATPSAAYENSFGNDKALHVVGGYAVSKYVTQQTGNQWQGCLASFAVGVAKEISDHHFGGQVEAADIGATVAGCVFKIRF